MSAELALSMSLALVLGAGIGFVHYHALRLVSQHFVEARFGLAISLQIARLALVGVALILAARVGALPLLACFGGILIGRAVVLRRARKQA